MILGVLESAVRRKSVIRLENLCEKILLIKILLYFLKCTFKSYTWDKLPFCISNVFQNQSITKDRLKKFRKDALIKEMLNKPI